MLSESRTHVVVVHPLRDRREVAHVPRLIAIIGRGRDASGSSIQVRVVPRKSSRVGHKATNAPHRLARGQPRCDPFDRGSKVVMGALTHDTVRDVVRGRGVFFVGVEGRRGSTSVSGRRGGCGGDRGNKDDRGKNLEWSRKPSMSV